MNIKTIKDTLGIISRVTISKISDKQLRKDLFNDYLALSKASKAFDEDIKTIQEKAFEGIDLNAHNELVAKIRKAESKGDIEQAENLAKEINPDTVKAIRDFNELYEEKVKEEQEIELVKTDTETFVDAMAEQDFAISMQELETLTSILK